MKNKYLQGLKRVDSNFNGLTDNGVSQIFAGGGWMNAATGLGTFQRDKVMQASYIDSLRITDPELSALFHSNDLASRIVELRPKEMFRRGYEVCFPDPDGEADGGQNAYAEDAEAVEEYAAKLRVNEMFRDGAIFGRLYGGTLLVLGIDDGLDQAEPVNEENIRSIKFINLIDRRFIFANTYYGDPMAEKYGEVETYRITSAFGDGQGVSVIHESRVIRFDGNPTEVLKRRQLAGWSLSVLQRVYDTLRQFDQSFQAAANLLVDASQGVFGLKGLMEMIANDPATLQTRMTLVDMNRSSGRSLMVDEENESFHREATSFAGIPDTLNVFMQRLASSAETPVTILFGREPSGLNATGEADFQHFYDTIASEQKNMMEPKLIRLFQLICLAKDGPCGGQVPESGIEIHWHALKEPNDMEKAELYGKMAVADCAYVTNQVLMPEEVALSRFRGGKFRLDTEIDVEARQQMKEDNLDFAKQEAKQKAEFGPQQPDPLGQGGEPGSKAMPPPGATDK